jgi:acetolactate synthase-1/2/3 large subunit
MASPEARIFCLVGDGAFAHVWSELETGKRLGVQLVIIVLNNQILGYQRQAENSIWGAHTEAIYFEPVDHAAIARACGVDGVRIEDPADFLPTVEAGLARGGVTLLDVLTDPEAYPPITAFDDMSQI